MFGDRSGDGAVRVRPAARPLRCGVRPWPGRCCHTPRAQARTNMRDTTDRTADGPHFCTAGLSKACKLYTCRSYSGFPWTEASFIQ